MTIADWYSVSSQAMANFAAFFALYLTLVSGYLLTAFVAGKSLSRAQVIVINAFFVLFTGFNLFAEIITIRNASAAFYRASAGVEGTIPFPEYFSTLFPVATLVLGTGMIIACLKFMWDIRHPKAE
jgi:hypothetical protein